MLITLETYRVKWSPIKWPVIKVLEKKQIVSETFIMHPPLSRIAIPRGVLFLSPLSSGHQELDNDLVCLCFKNIIHL